MVLTLFESVRPFSKTKLQRLAENYVTFVLLGNEHLDCACAADGARSKWTYSALKYVTVERGSFRAYLVYGGRESFGI